MHPLLLTALPVAAIGGLGWVRAHRAMRQLYPAPLATGPDPAAVVHDPARPTAVVLLDHAGTEVSDFLLPYELLAATGQLNVHAVAPQLRSAPLTGGLDVVPHASFDTFVDLPLDRADLVVVPAMRRPDPRTMAWIIDQAHRGASVLSICSGAAVVAPTGLFDGRRATSFWADIDRLERGHPQVEWVRGVRYVQDGPVAASAGISSGIDATLAIIAQLVGSEAMGRAADRIGYTDRRYLNDPTVTQHRIRPADVIFPLTAAFAPRPTTGIWLTDGVDETSLAAALDTFAATLAARTRTSAASPTITSRHGLTLRPRTSPDELGHVRQVLLPGTGAPVTADRLPADVTTVHLPPVGDPPYAALPAAVAHLAATHGRPIARFAAKRLELPPRSPQGDHR